MSGSIQAMQALLQLGTPKGLGAYVVSANDAIKQATRRAEQRSAVEAARIQQVEATPHNPPHLGDKVDIQA